MCAALVESPTGARPLQFKWSFWETRTANQKSMQTQDWKNLQQHLCSFNNTEDFWHYYGSLPKPSQVFYDGKERTRRRVGNEGDERVIESFSLFKNGIEPSWEDDGNIRGGEWWIRKQVQPGMLDRWWENLVLGLVGCTIENGDEIAGARVVDKSKVGDGRTIVKIELWLRTKDLSTRTQLLERMCEILVDGDPSKPQDLQKEFQWKVHGV